MRFTHILRSFRPEFVGYVPKFRGNVEKGYELSFDRKSHDCLSVMTMVCLVCLPVYPESTGMCPK